MGNTNLILLFIKLFLLIDNLKKGNASIKSGIVSIESAIVRSEY